MMYLFLVLLIAPLLLLVALLYRHRARTRRLQQAREQARREAEQGLVPCFTCGMKVPRESALEKKGRYFCGVKKVDRENNRNPGG
ncbi:MAG: hypothetical protein OQL28_02630 [Sedimenticola sp.]|nr:hypothetical protein [Sedimenticola sp.]